LNGAVNLPRGRVVSSPPATEETGTMGREIESRQGGSFKKNDAVNFTPKKLITRIIRSKMVLITRIIRSKMVLRDRSARLSKLN
jgi:hypothetical protein